MPTILLSVQEFNDLRIQAALAAWRREAPHVRQKPGGNGVVPGRVFTYIANPPKSREFETGFVTPPTRRGARRGGRPRIYSGSAARQRAYRARQLTLLVEPRPEDGGAQ
jgi:hypothetical protein